MSAPVLALNVGSSSLRFALFDRDGDRPTPLLRGMHDRGADPGRVTLEAEGGAPAPLDVADPDDRPALVRAVLDRAERAAGAAPLVAHRVVHGGGRHVEPLRLTPGTLDELAALAHFAPLHQAANLEPARVLADARPDLAQWAVFDSAFHATMPPLARRLPLSDDGPVAGLRREGFHGLSYASVARQMGERRPAARRVLATHMSGGTSACAMLDGRSVDTTMGLTPLDGPMMGTRSGAVDPGALLWLLRHGGLDVDGLEGMLWRRSGLLGVSGLSADTRDLERSDDPRAAEALDLYALSVARALAGLLPSLGGVDALVFTGGAGANGAALRARVCDRLGWLGIRLAPLDWDGEGQHPARGLVSADDSAVEVWALEGDEEAEMALALRDA